MGGTDEPFGATRRCQIFAGVRSLVFSHALGGVSWGFWYRELHRLARDTPWHGLASPPAKGVSPGLPQTRPGTTLSWLCVEEELQLPVGERGEEGREEPEERERRERREGGGERERVREGEGEGERGESVCVCVCVCV